MKICMSLPFFVPDILGNTKATLVVLESLLVIAIDKIVISKTIIGV